MEILTAHVEGINGRSGGETAAGLVHLRASLGRPLRPATRTDRPMADYQLEGPKPARMYEVILPKKIGYFGKVEEVLEDLFNEDAIRAIPFVRKSIARARRRDPGFDEDAWVKTL